MLSQVKLFGRTLTTFHALKNIYEILDITVKLGIKDLFDKEQIGIKEPLGWFKNPVSSQTEKLMAGTKFSDYLGLNHYKKAKIYVPVM